MKNILKKWKIALVMLLIYTMVWFLRRETGVASVAVATNYAKEMILIMPAVLLIMGLIEVWVPKERIQQLLGKDSGIKGMALSFALGTLPTGPLYAAFPMSASLLKKGARISNVIIFMGSWAALKIPQLLVEIEFLGLQFAALRFILTLVAIVASGYVIEYLMKNPATHHWVNTTVDVQQTLKKVRMG
jgi:uncharacterized membrane protein YraQ (UPF0718 family)